MSCGAPNHTESFAAMVGFGRKSPTQEAWDLVDAQQWSKLHTLLRSKEDRDKINLTKRRYCKEAEGRVPLLSFALIKGAPEVIVERFLRVSPEATIHLDVHGRSPLHIACIHERSPGIVDLLLKVDEDRVSLKDSGGNLPLHYAVSGACRLRDEAHLDVVTSLMGCAPDTVKIRNIEGNSPLDIARSLDRAKDRTVFQMLVCTTSTLKVKASRAVDCSLPRSPSNLRMSNVTDDTELSSLRFRSSMFSASDDINKLAFRPQQDDSLVDWDDSERQAVGERPQRRNGIIIHHPNEGNDAVQLF